MFRSPLSVRRPASARHLDHLDVVRLKTLVYLADPRHHRGSSFPGCTPSAATLSIAAATIVARMEGRSMPGNLHGVAPATKHHSLHDRCRIAPEARLKQTHDRLADSRQRRLCPRRRANPIHHRVGPGIDEDLEEFFADSAWFVSVP